MNPQNVNVLVIAPYRFLPAVNGGHKAIERLYSHLGELKQVNIVSVKSNDESFAKKFRLYKLFSNSPLHYINPFLFFRLRKFIKKERITHIFTEHPYMGWLAFLLKKNLRVKWILRSHNIEALRFKTLQKSWWKSMLQYEKWVCQKADLCFFITSEDKAWAVANYSLPNSKAIVITFGIDAKYAPSGIEKNEAKNLIRQQYNIPAEHRILLFNGDLGYEPNSEAVQFIIDEIYPWLQSSGFPFTLLICGRNLSESLQKKISACGSNLVYAGFVNDIKEVFLASDIFINPVISGGGIKTKLVEALSFGCNAVSTVSGALGIPEQVVGNQLAIVPDNDWTTFAYAVTNANLHSTTSEDFYDYFYWGNIARKALSELENLQAE